MGGNAITGARRISAAEYETLCDEINHRLTILHHELCGGYGYWHFVRPYASKADHGDIDVVLNTSAIVGFDWKELIKKYFDVTRFVNNNVLSIEYKGVQVDFIPATDEEYSFRYYYDYNDLGNLIGRIAHKMDLRFGHDGLFFPVRDPSNSDHYLGEICLTTDFLRAIQFLGFNPNVWRAGFQELEDIFKYVAAGSFFDKKLFYLEDRSHRARVRDKKRKTYIAFLKWLEEKNPPANFDWEGPKTEYVGYIARHFDHFQAEYDHCMLELEKNKQFKRLFNGEIARNATGWDGEDLGHFMKTFKAKFKDETTMRDFFLAIPKSYALSVIHNILQCHQAEIS